MKKRERKEKIKCLRMWNEANHFFFEAKQFTFNTCFTSAYVFKSSVQEIVLDSLALYLFSASFIALLSVRSLHQDMVLGVFSSSEFCVRANAIHEEHFLHNSNFGCVLFAFILLKVNSGINSNQLIITNDYHAADKEFQNFRTSFVLFRFVKENLSLFISKK